MNTETLTKIWLIGVAAWGGLWTTSLGDLPMDGDGRLSIAAKLWRSQLADHDPIAVMKAMAQIAGSQKYPPTLADVKAVCKDQAAEQQRQLPAYNDANHRMWQGKVSARSAFNESVADNCRAFNAQCEAYGYEHRDYNHS